MIFKILVALVFMFSINVHSAECTAYETSHPFYKLDGAHLSTGKCKTCASCHLSGTYMGTPRTCVLCHNGDPRWQTVARSASHIPTILVACDACHSTTSFTSNVKMNHTSMAASRCDSCHNGLYTKYGAEGKNKDHKVTTKDCRDCHKSTSSWDA
ncbi:MAG: hypothetical protein HOP04_05775 [Methylophilaceae bacterium]|nr:hypothetical protein [Methylophilaceae bacterium]